jgi:SAM-dependent methyltransferase
MSAELNLETRDGIRFRQLDACPCCGSDRTRTMLAHGKDFESGLGEFTVLECDACGAAYTTPQPLAEDVYKMYSSRESHDFDESTAFVSWLRRINNERQLKRLPARMKTQEIVALDYGCGGGFFTRTMRQFLKGRIIASDFHDVAPPLIQADAAIEYKRDDQLDEFAGQLDVIICRNVLEHTVDPLKFLDRLRRLLKLSGVVLIEVPNRRSMWMKLFGRYAFNYYLPRHLFHYDEASLTKHLDGFKVVGMWRDHSPILGKSVGHLLGRKISGFGLSGLFMLPGQVLIDSLLRRSSQLVVVAERTR